MILVAAALAAPLPAEAVAAEARPSPSVDTGLTFLGLSQTRIVASDVVTENPLVNGQIVGTLGGSNTTTTDDVKGLATEQRVGGFFRYAPDLLNGKVALDAAFEVDFAWGDTSYSIGGNTGGGIGGDQVNLQTRRLAVRASPYKGATAVVGLQFVSDSVNDPGASRLEELTRSGGRLMLFGTEMAGVTLYGKASQDQWEWLRYKAGGYQLYEQGLSASDDVFLYTAAAQLAPAYATRVGLQGWWLRDRALGDGGFLGTGVTSDLSEMQGGPALDFRASESDPAPDTGADLFWVMADAGYNAQLDRGDAGVHGVVGTNQGAVYVLGGLPDHPVAGYFADVEGRWRWAPGDGSVMRLEAVWSSGDDPDDLPYSGVVTANSYGIVGAMYSTHGCLLLFPDVGAVNRQSAVVYDVSGGGAGLLGLTASIGYDPIPDRLNVTLGAGHARDMYGHTLGTEVNGRVAWEAWTLGTLSAQAATVKGTSLPHDPWTALVALDWLVI